VDGCSMQAPSGTAETFLTVPAPLTQSPAAA
jgi:hypothetical protein